MESSEELSRVPRWRKVRAVLCASLVNLMIGTYYFYSNVNGYVAAYLRSFDPWSRPRPRSS